MKDINYYRMLKIDVKGDSHTPLREVTDEEVLSKYQSIRDTIVSFLQDAMLAKVNTPEEKERKEKNIENLKGFLDGVNEAFKALETEEKRKKYEEEYEKNLTGDILLRRLAKYQGKSLEKVEEKRTNISSKATNVREDKSHIPYTPAYEGNEIQLLELAKINFFNGPNMQDELLEYILLFKKDNRLIPLGYDFYANNIVIEKLKEPMYRAVFCEAIKRAILKKERYIGEVSKDINQEYYIKIDDGRRSAANEHQLQLENARKRQKKQEEQEETR